MTDGTAAADAPAAPSLAWLFRRIGVVLAIAAGAVSLKWPPMFDLDAYLAAARAVAAGQSPYAAIHAAGVAEWGSQKVYVSPPLVADVLAPFSALPTGVVAAGWTAAGVLALLAAIRLVDRGTLAARAPLLVFSFVYVWGSAVLGQVNLFTMAGLLLAFASRSDRIAGTGFALAVVTRATPAAFVVLFVLERRWRMLAWAAATIGITVVLLRPADWIDFVSIVREAATLPTLMGAVVQTSVAPVHALWLAVAIVVAAILAISVVVERDRPLRAGTAIGLALVLLPTNAWYHWLSFALVPLFLFGDDRTWSRRALLAFLATSFIDIGWLSSGVAIAVLVVILVLSLRDFRAVRPPFRARGAAILGQP